MKHTLQTGARTETRVLGAIALVSYSTTFAAVLAFSYSLLALALAAAGRDLAAVVHAAGT